MRPVPRLYNGHCAGEGQQQFNQPTKCQAVESLLGGHQVQLFSFEPVAIQQRREHRSRGIFIVKSCYLTKSGGNIEALMFGLVICRVCRSVKLF
jgi:hypothetical protein